MTKIVVVVVVVIVVAGDDVEVIIIKFINAYSFPICVWMDVYIGSAI